MDTYSDRARGVEQNICRLLATREQDSMSKEDTKRIRCAKASKTLTRVQAPWKNIL